MRRINIFQQNNSKNIVDFNNKYTYDVMKQLILIIDDFANLIYAADKDFLCDLLSNIMRYSRITGISVIVSTQRPSANALHTNIKHLFDVKIAFGVTSKIDSRIIIDTDGAEKLTSPGDMIIRLKKDPNLLEVRGYYVSDSEINAIVKYINKYYS